MATKKLLTLISFVVGITVQLLAQGNCFFTHYSSEDGLSQNTVMSMLQDQKGAMWFATWDGINKFNGYSFTTYKAGQGSQISLTNNRVDYMYEDKYGYLWLQTYDNTVHRFNPQTETFEQVPASGEGSTFRITSINLLGNGTVWLLTDDEGAIRVSVNPQTHQVTPEIYTLKSGLFPADKYNKVYLDKNGNEWVLTNNGLGMIPAGQKTIETYFVESQGTPQHAEQSFYAICEDANEIYFGSDKGRLWRFQKKDQRFLLLEVPTKRKIVGINKTTPDEILIATDKDGFFTYRLSNYKLTHYSHATCKALLNTPILSTYMDKNSEVWFEQEEPGCVMHFNPFTQEAKLERLVIEPAAADRSRPNFHVHEDIRGVVWVHPFGGGLARYDREQNKLIPFYNEPGSKDWRFSNKIHSTFSDKQGNLWIGTHSKGLEKVTFRPIQFHLTTPHPDEIESLRNEVRSLLEDKDQNVWVGLKSGELRVYNKNRQYLGYLTNTGVIAKTGTPMKGVAYNLLQDSNGVLWIATKGDGLIRAEKTSGASNAYHLTRYVYSVDDIYSLSNDNVYCVYEDKKGRLWIATFAGGLNYMDKDENGNVVFINHRNHLKGYPIDNCYKARFVTSDNNGHIWVGTTTGAICFDADFTNPENIVFHHYARVPSNPNSLSNNDVHWIINTAQNELFLATFGGGLNKLMSMDEEGNATFASYSVHDGLPSDVLLSIREDEKENLWLSTEHGISKFLPSANQFENYDDKSITFRVRFNEAASTITADGNILFGASNGIFRFHPDSIYKSSYVPPVLFSRLYVANQEVIPGEHSILKNSLDNTQDLVLTHKENIVSIQYAALDYTNPANVQYAYMMEGLDKQWTYADKLRSATYTHLPKGKYTFKVRSTNSDGVWVENTRSLNVEILPSFWETPLAYSLYVICIILFILVAVYVLFTIYRLKHEVSIEQQVSDIKLRFFTNVSHELRTPLTLIAGPVECVLKNKDLPAEAREQLLVVERNTNRMLRLVNQILDFRKIQNKKMKMQVGRVNVVPFVRKVMDNFESIAEEHHIDFVLETEKDDLYLWVDDDKLEKIIFNLLSNAFKYTANGKMIAVFIREDQDTVTIEVRDQGIGIADNKKGSIFVRFENLMDKNLFNQSSSSGIGLSLVKELVEMHKAVISVDSKLGEGSSFKVEFLKGRDHYDESVEYILEDSNKVTVFEKVVDEDNPSVTEEVLIGNTTARNHPQQVMLLVEDNQELRHFLRSIFSQKFKVIEAVDGMEGWDKALKFLPDIIISDVMMPEKDGIEMMKELHADVTTSHIPIVLLTAKTAIESKLEGLELGADDYITKPFSATYLQARVDNILFRRSKLQAIYRANLMGEAPTETSGATPITHAADGVDTSSLSEEDKQPAMSSIDRKFMDKLLELMEKNMDNGDLVVDDFVSELAVSRSVFFKKLKMLTGLAPIEFIKEMRIKRAAQLIETGEFNMTQISYMVGINDPRYFSKCFKQKFNMTPTEYRDKVLKR
ncbi:hybrid sensor histidine kinase/response regulator transcription factor [Bacteroides sp. 51]|uniref:hybrid sensor histidine kinase/response regulator transcription factor n=1 Tax=Bacteroides sp. 51 TaxID=2302938 RepID=UPI0013D1C263|nr:hybrid sensor histidine kinase/response regulator transcription factor [Bacteroides sp. 51]NDV81250.1 hybrid sensor histidine kinase/response regulator [Bacteroides sp. 51]